MGVAFFNQGQSGVLERPLAWSELGLHHSKSPPLQLLSLSKG